MKRLISIILVALLIVGMCVPCFADDVFTPSANSKGAPELYALSKSNPDVVGAIYNIVNNNTPHPDYILVEELMKGDLSISSYANRGLAGEDIGAELEQAYGEIQNAASLSALCPELDTLAQLIDPEYTAENLVVSELFDLTLVNHTLDENHVLFVRMKSATQFDGHAPIVIHRTEAGWQAVPADRIDMLRDGTFTVEFDELCPVAILKVAPAYEPDTEKDHCLAGLLCFDLFGGLFCTCWLFLGILFFIILLLIAVCIAFAYRKNALKKKLEDKSNDISWQAVAIAGMSFLTAGAMISNMFNGGRRGSGSKKHKD